MLSSDVNVENLAFITYCELVCVGWINTLQPFNPNIGYSILCGPVLAGGAVVTNAFHSFNVYWNMCALNNNGYEHRR